MGFRQILFLVFLSGMLGSIVGFLGSDHFQNKTKSTTHSAIQKLNALSDEEFISQYPAQKHLLTLSEQALADRLYACLDRPKAAPSLSKASSSQMRPAEKESVKEVERPEDTSSDEFSIYARANASMAPRVVPGALLQRIFRNRKFAMTNEESNGVLSGLVDDAQEFLRKQGQCVTPTFAAITDESKSRSRFFEFVKENSFKGVTTVTVTPSNSGEKKLDTLIEFNSPKHEGYDYLEVQDAKKNFLEKRIIKADESDDAWRYSSCAPSVVLVSDKCPWNSNYVYEFKNFYLSTDSKKLIGDVYCKKPSDKQWTNIGSFDLKQIDRD
ncbi:MAG: hypothetical protein R2877_06860 [Bdellovibrionota bacterium]